jgi:rod shape determining protein RodA
MMVSHAYPRPFEESQRPGEAERAGFLRLDPLLLIATLGLIGFGIFALGKVTGGDVPHDPYYYVLRQAIYAVIGFALMLALARVDYSRFRELRVGLYTAMMGGIILVLLLGQATRGSRRWIELPFFTFQPSELGKVLLIAALAGFAIDRARRVSEQQRTARLMLMGFVPAMIVAVQPDLGTAVTYTVITLAILFVAGVRWTHFALLGMLLATAVSVVLVISPAIGHPILKDYQQERLTSFLNPSSDPRDATYQIDQSLIAIGSGGKKGRGADSTQTENGFVPDRTTDFIFSVVGERFGFVGAAFVLSLYALLIWRALRIMTLSKNLYGSLIAGAIASMFMCQVFVNVGVAIGIMPVTGITLPLLSFGGSSVVVTLMAIGLLQSIYVQARLTAKSRADLLR